MGFLFVFLFLDDKERVIWRADRSLRHYPKYILSVYVCVCVSKAVNTKMCFRCLLEAASSGFHPPPPPLDFLLRVNATYCVRIRYVFFHVHGSMHRDSVSIIVQQDATIYNFIIFLQTDLHISGDTFTHHQEPT